MRWQRTTLPLQAKPKCWQPHLYPSGGGLAESITHPLKSKMLPTTLQLQSGSEKNKKEIISKKHKLIISFPN